MTGRKYILTTNVTIKEFNYLQDLIDILATDKISELTNMEIVFLNAGMNIERKNSSNRFMYKVEVKAE